MYVCVHVCTYLSMHVCLSVCLSVYLYACTYAVCIHVIKQGACEPEHGAWQPGLPILVTAFNGCPEHEGHDHGHRRALAAPQGAFTQVVTVYVLIRSMHG